MYEDAFGAYLRKFIEKKMSSSALEGVSTKIYANIYSRRYALTLSFSTAESLIKI